MANRSKEYQKGWTDAIKAVRLFLKEEMKAHKREEKECAKQRLYVQAFEENVTKETCDFFIHVLDNEFDCEP